MDYTDYIKHKRDPTFVFRLLPTLRSDPMGTRVMGLDMLMWNRHVKTLYLTFDQLESLGPEYRKVPFHGKVHNTQDMRDLERIYNLVTLELYRYPQDLSGIQNLVSLKQLNLHLRCNVEGLERVAKLPYLNTLTSEHALDLKYLQDCPKLKGLSITSGMDRNLMAPLPKLESLQIKQHYTNPFTAEHLRGFKRLTELSYTSDHVRIKDCADLQYLTHLERVTLNMPHLRSTRHLTRMTNLSHLTLKVNRVDNLKHLKHCKKLHSLDIAQSQLSYEVIRSLSKIPNLKHLYVNQYQVSDLPEGNFEVIVI